VIDFSRNHFDLFGLPPVFRLDAAALDQAYRKLQSDVHPDRFAGGSDAQKRLALQASARVNEAYLALKNPVQRAQYLLALHGIDAVAQTDTHLPMEFLERQLERREQAEEATAAQDLRALSSLLADVQSDISALELVLARKLDDDRAFATAKSQVRELTFLAKLADDLDGMLAMLDS
jgi:molecular chaperone HscB